MGDIKRILRSLKENLRTELENIKKLKGDALAEFIDIFNIEGEPEIYFNSYNIIICDPITYSHIKGYLNPKGLIVKIELLETHDYMWVHQYFNDRIFNDYLK